MPRPTNGVQMERNYEVFPRDENGEVLWRAHEHGLEIGADHRVRFALLFPEGNDALKFAVFLLRHNYWVQVNELEDKPDYPGEVLVEMVLEVTHAEITGAESWLATQCAGLGGKVDGGEIRERIPQLVSSSFEELPEGKAN